MKIKPVKHVTNCPYCKAEGNRVLAKWHLTGANRQACDAHKWALEHIRDKDFSNLERHYSEADEQTWRKL